MLEPPGVQDLELEGMGAMGPDLISWTGTTGRVALNGGGSSLNKFPGPAGHPRSGSSCSYQLGCMMYGLLPGQKPGYAAEETDPDSMAAEATGQIYNEPDNVDTVNTRLLDDLLITS